MLTVEPTPLGGVIVMEPVIHGDDRGFFIETYQRDAYRDAGVLAEFVQDNHSRSQRGTIRGLHFQTRPGQAKLVRVVRGSIVDVVVDLRRSAPTFGRHVTIELDDRLHRQLFVPVGLAHGFCVTSDEADVVYKVDAYYDPATERGLAWDDPEVGIAWPVADPTLSLRDRSNPTLAELREHLPDW